MSADPADNPTLDEGVGAGSPPSDGEEIEVRVDRERSAARAIVPAGLSPDTVTPQLIAEHARERGVSITPEVEKKLVGITEAYRATGEAIEAHYERSDVCVVPAGGVIAEAMVVIVLAEAMLEKFGGDNLEETKRNHQAYLRTVRPRGRE